MSLIVLRLATNMSRPALSKLSPHQVVLAAQVYNEWFYYYSKIYHGYDQSEGHVSREMNTSLPDTDKGGGVGTVSICDKINGEEMAIQIS